jgi:hypothetical protein
VSRLAVALLLAASAALVACGTPSADLFVVERAGELPDAKLTLVVGDGGTVECDGEEQPISSARLLEAREIARDLQPLLDRRESLPGGDRALLRFRVLGEDGEVRFADITAPREPVLARLLAFTRNVAREACGLER